MGDGSLSQDEIDALLQGADDMLASPGPSMGAGPSSSSSGLSPVEKDSLSDLLNGVMGSVAPSMSAYLQKQLRISNAIVEVKGHDALVGDFPKQYVQVSLGYSGGINGKNLIVLNMNDAGVISSLMMGDETGKPPADLSEAHQSTLQEFVNGLLSAGATQIGERIGRKNISATSPNLSIVNGGSDLDLPMGDCVKITYNLNIEGLISSKMYHIIELSMANELSRGGKSSGGGMQMGGGGGGFGGGFGGFGGGMSGGGGAGRGF